MGSMSRRARSANLTGYGMVAAEHFQCFTRRTHTTLLCVFEALPDALKRIGLRGDVKQPLIGFGILHDRFRLPIDRKNQRFLRLLEVLHELPWIAAECGHRLNVSFNVKHSDLALTMIAPLKVSLSHIAVAFLDRLDAAERSDRRKIGRSFLWLSGSAPWLHRAGNNDLLRRTFGCCEANLLFGTPEEALEFPATLPFRPFRSGGFQA